MDKIPVRIVIPCRKAHKTIEHCLAALFRSREVELEVILVDDGENGNLSALTAKYRVTIKRSSGRTGAGAARNLGANGYEGKILVFVDADVEVAEDAITRLVKPIRNGLADATVGRYSEDVKGMGFAEAYKQLYLAYTYGGSQRNLVNTFWTALGAVRTEQFHAVGGFSENFRGAGPEDLDLGIKLTKAGARILAVPEVVGRHLARFNLVGLLANDLRKGSEDIYLHWLTRVPLTNNRHAKMADIAAVVVAWAALASGLVFALRNFFFLGMIISLYAALRGRLLFQAYFRKSELPLISVFLLTYILDLLRGLAVVAGTVLAWLDLLSHGRFQPFNRSQKTIS